METPHVLQLALNDSCDALNAASPEQVRNAGSESLVYHRVQRQVVQYGLARHRGDASTKKSHQRARVTRLERQIAIVEKYHREKARHEARLRDQGDTRGANHGSLSAAIVIAEHPVSRFPRKASLRQLPQDSLAKNQHEETLGDPANPRALYPSTTLDSEKFALRASQPVVVKHGPTSRHVAALVSGAKHPSTPKKPDKHEPATSRTCFDKSTAQVLSELKITKDIIMREHLVTQIHDVVGSLNQLAADLHDMAKRKAKYNSSNGSTSTGFSARRPSGSLSGSAIAKQRPKSGDITSPAPTDPARRDAEIQDWEARSADLVHKAHHCITQLYRLIQNLQTTTIGLVESILEWRASKSKPAAISNIEKVYRFGWKKCKIANYLVHIDSDLRDLFPSPAMSVVLGTTTKYNPLLASRPALDALGIAEDTFASTTFLTEQQDGSQSVPSDVSSHEMPSPTSAYVALLNAVKTIIFTNKTTSQMQVDAQRLRNCLDAIQRERELECNAIASQAAETQRQATAYNPFESIKVAGGIEDVLANALAQQPEVDTQQRAEKLRRRQENASQANEPACGPTSSQDEASSSRAPTLYVNPGRMRRLIEQRKDVHEAATDCELRDTTASRIQNKLRGQVMVRRMNIRRIENKHARTIQQQFLVYRRRTQLLKNLAQFVVTSRQRVVSIQKLARGFIAKQRYKEAKQHHERQQERRRAARTIWYAYKRHKRRQRHRQSMSVEAVAQIQLFHVLQHQLDDVAGNESSTAERFRKVGEERRRQRAVHLYNRRQELLQLEAQRAAAAVSIQSMYRMHSAKKLALALRGERRAHMSAVSAMMIQSKIRTFLRHQEKRRQRFRSDMERVNRSAVRIQSIYRGYNSRASLMDELNALAQQHVALYDSDRPFEEGDEEEEEDDDDVSHDTHPGPSERQAYIVLPPIVRSRPSTATASQEPPVPLRDRPLEEEAAPIQYLPVVPTRASVVPTVSLPPIRLRAQSQQPVESQRKAQPPPPRHTSNATAKVELKLKETTLGDDLAPTTSGHASRGFMGPLRRRMSGAVSGALSSRGSISSEAGIDGRSPRR